MSARVGKQIARTVVSLFLTLLFLLSATVGSIFYASGNGCFFSGEAQAYYEELISLGFPADYAARLTELHLLHPSWEFAPLLITEECPAYTWDYIIDKETEEPDNNLIFSGSSYAPYRHPFNDSLYDAGHYQASREAVEYFMDPRNFLNETDIFQFFDLSHAVGNYESAVESVLEGTFMEDALLENGMTYAAYFCHAGNELSMNPIFLATKVRQEMGVGGTSPVISGECGSLLADYYVNQTTHSQSGKEILPPSEGYTAEELRAFDGLYNLFNVGASGKGLFTIYHKSMEYAEKGTPEMAETWGGDPSWSTLWKALYGGAYFLKTRYVDVYQSTVYLQKFNVDSRVSDKNFWKQYSQNVTAALSEGRTLFQSMAEAETLDFAYRFLIPVYGDMPRNPCLDPANGSCSYTATADNKYSYEGIWTAPTRQFHVNAPLYADLQLEYGSDVSFSANLTHSYGIERLEYRVDGGEWIPLTDTEQLSLTLQTDFLPLSSHILVVRGKSLYDPDVSTKKSNAYFLCGVFYITERPREVTLAMEVGNTRTERVCLSGDEITLPVCETEDFVGWLGSDGSLLPSGALLTVTDDVTFKAIFLDWEILPGASLSTLGEPPHMHFFALLRDGDWRRIAQESDGSLAFYGMIEAQSVSAGAIQMQKSAELRDFPGVDGCYRIDVSTDAIGRADYGTRYRVRFVAEVVYTDGSTRTLNAPTLSDERSVLDVARAALADTEAGYAEEVIRFLTSLLAATTLD
ncbi:MAG: hypothetical protein IIU88_01015 [Clostridia bacterium]|nr:hypothetical protein [Clostridia bacterium]